MRAVFFALAMLAGIAVARGDWQSTRWGMSADQLRATNPHLQEPSDAERSSQTGAMGTPLLKGVHSMGGKDFVSWFYFRSGSLARIRLDAIDKNLGHSILSDLRTMYGDPLKEVNVPIQSCDRFDVFWLDRKGRNAIRFDAAACAEERHKWTNRASIYYEPIPAE